MLTEFNDSDSAIRARLRKLGFKATAFAPDWRDWYDDLLKRMAIGFSEAWQEADGRFRRRDSNEHLSRHRPDRGGRVAYFLVDALRYEMGVELRDQLQGAEELAIRAGGRDAADASRRSGWRRSCPERRRASRSSRARGSSLRASSRPSCRVSPSAEVPQGEGAGRRRSAARQAARACAASKLKTTIGDASLVLVRSQEIDLAGELDTDSSRDTSWRP